MPGDPVEPHSVQTCDRPGKRDASPQSVDSGRSRDQATCWPLRPAAHVPIIGDLSAIHNKLGRQSPFGIGAGTDGTVVGAMSPQHLSGSYRATVRPSWCEHVAVKIVGLIGGMSWESSAEYYRLMNEFVREEMGGLHSARCLLYSLDFAEIERLQATGAWKEAEDLLVAAGQSLELAGADFLVLCTNTMHKVAEGLEARVSLPLVHIADVVAEAVSATGIIRVGLLGTAFTMEQSFYKDRLATRGIEVIVPSSADRKTVHRIIYEELCVGTIREQSRDASRAIIGRLVAAGAEGIVLDCTELELLVRPEDSPAPVFPTTRLHAAAAVRRALAIRAEDDLELLEAPADSAAAVRLLARYYEELATRFPGGFEVDRSAAAPEAELRPPSGCFLIARTGGRSVGCGAVRKLDESTAEVKRMWIDPSVRGRGIGRRLLAGLESAAQRLGCTLVRLDTSSHLPEALRLYRSSGYREIPAYNDNFYAHHWFEKSLGSKAPAGTDTSAKEPA